MVTLSLLQCGWNTRIQHSTLHEVSLDLKLEVLRVGYVRKCMALFGNKESHNVAFSRVQARTLADASDVSLLVCEQMETH